MRAAMWTALLCLVLMPSAHADDVVTGTYEMKSGEVLVQQTDGRMKFSLNATYQTNVGEVSGEVPLTEVLPITSIRNWTAHCHSSSRPASSS